MSTLPLSMRRVNCNLELCLVTPSSYSSSSSIRSTTSDSYTSIDGSEENPQQLTIFFNGRICVCDVTELQARTILSIAGREMDERMKMRSTSSDVSPASTKPVQMQSHQQPSPNTNGISMKRSLQRFLQKRKNRIQTTSYPYNKQ